MMTDIVTNLFYYVRPQAFNHNKKKRIIAKKALLKLKDYLHDLKRRIITKDFSKNNSYIIGCVFRNLRKINNENERNQYIKANLLIAIEAFDNLVDQIEKREKTINARAVRKYSALISEFIFDLKPFVEYLERKKNPEFEFFRGWTIYQNSAFELFRTSESLYWYPIIDIKPINKKAATNLNVFSLRQSLEIKFKRIFGIFELYNKDLKDIILRHDFFPTFICENLELIDIEMPNINMSEVLKIYNWTNYTIHNAVNPPIWQIYYSIKICNSFFKSGEYRRNDDRQRLSIYASVKIKNNDYLIEKLMHKIYAVNNNKIFCFNNVRQEAVIDEKVKNERQQPI